MKKIMTRMCYGSLIVCTVTCLGLFVILPLIYKFSPGIQRQLIFASKSSDENNAHFEKPEIYGTRNFYINYYDQTEKQNVKIGVWHILPNNIVETFANELQINKNQLKKVHTFKQYEKSVAASANEIRNEFVVVNADNEANFFERMLKIDGAKIVLYMHGKGETRAKDYRIRVYNLLREQGYHVIAFDYRGYGDSMPDSPTEDGVVSDAVEVYKYVLNVTNNAVFVWGHSLGTGIACHMFASLKQQNIVGPRALVLESPFNNLRDAVSEFPTSTLFRFLPWFDYTIRDPIYNNKLRFESDKHIAAFPQPVLILHAVDDDVVPFKLGEKLLLSAQANRPKSWGPVKLEAFDITTDPKSDHTLDDKCKTHEYKCDVYEHIRISQAEKLPGILNEFFQTYENKTF